MSTPVHTADDSNPNGSEESDNGASSASTMSESAGRSDSDDPGGSFKTEGQRLLVDVGGSLAEVGKRLGCDRQRVSEWRRGDRSPSDKMRKTMERVLAIPVSAWDISLCPIEDEDEPTPAELSTMEAIDALLASIRASRNSRLTSAERIKLNDSEMKALNIRARLEKQAELLEDRIVREHPAFARSTQAILEALAPYPEAAQAVADALTQLVEDDG